jgi:hypothetical protein
MICLPTLHAVLLLCFIIGITAWYISLTEDRIYNKYLLPINTNANIDKQYIDKQYIEKRNENVLYNEFKPPERRVPEYQYPTKFVKSQINIPTRGYPEDYQVLGNVFRDNTETAYNLFGRQTYPGSNQYEYYVTGSDTNGSHVKIPIKIKGDKEINDNDTINIPGTNKDKGEFKVKLYNIDTPRYIPVL